MAASSARPSVTAPAPNPWAALLSVARHSLHAAGRLVHAPRRFESSPRQRFMNLMHFPDAAAWSFPGYTPGRISRLSDRAILEGSP
jgi:hypothetical protein